jgi:hypothetical protein
VNGVVLIVRLKMTMITFSDEDLLYLDKEQDDQLRFIRQAIDIGLTRLNVDNQHPHIEY